jgi:Domain of unknown function (DUF5655)
MSTRTESPTVAAHFDDRDPVVKAIYTKVLAAARKLGPVSEDPKKTSIHLVRESAFAGVATRRSALILTLKSKTDIVSPRIVKHERVSSNRWHLEVRLEQAADVDRELLSWLKQSYELSG